MVDPNTVAPLTPHERERALAYGDRMRQMMGTQSMGLISYDELDIIAARFEATIRALEPDRARMDWLEGEKMTWGAERALFRRNVPITRKAVDSLRVPGHSPGHPEKTMEDSK